MASPEEPRERGAAAVSSRDRILMAGKRLFASQGYENTSTVAIARLAGTSESQLMKHFGSKEGLLEAIFDQGWEKMRHYIRAVQELNTPAEKLRALLDLVVSGWERDKELKELMLLEGRRVRKEGKMVLLTRGYLEFVGVIDALLAEMRTAGQLRTDLDPEAVRSGLMGLFEGMLRDQILAQRVGYPADYSPKELRRVFDAVLAAIVVQP